MWGRYILTQIVAAERYFRLHEAEWRESWNIAPSQSVPVVRWSAASAMATSCSGASSRSSRMAYSEEQHDQCHGREDRNRPDVARSVEAQPALHSAGDRGVARPAPGLTEQRGAPGMARGCPTRKPDVLARSTAEAEKLWGRWKPKPDPQERDSPDR